MEAFVFRNESRQLTSNNYLQFQMKGKDGNKFAIGTIVKLFIGKTTMVQELMPSRGFQSSMDYVLTFGLGQHSKIDSIAVIWPNKKITTLTDVPVNQKILLSQDEAQEWKQPKPEQIKQKTLFTEIWKNELKSHEEDLFDDFDQEGLVIKQLSREGPALAVADVDGDGNEDVFIGGSKSQSGKIYLHAGDGRLKPVTNQSLEADAKFEDTAASFFDADGDGDLDLAVGSGGNIAAEKSSYITRLYINEGHGRFTRTKTNLPSAKTNISVIAPHDFDGDGDVDMFVGSRSVPGVFGVNPQHLFLINDGRGTFSDGTERYAYDLKNAGMVTDAEWSDVDGDKRLDLITVSDWGAPVVLRNSGRRLSKWQSSLDSLNGWWKTIETSDLDGDGDQDFIIGNSGLNIPYPATAEKPMSLWINDFDENGTIEQIMTVHSSNGDYPIHMRRDITAQLPKLKKENLKATDYSKRTIQELFAADVVNHSVVKTSTVSESVIAVNEGNGRFSIKSLPDRVQWSCVCDISCTDVNGDGITDLVMGGNNFDFKPQFSRQDASFGHVLIGKGKLDFEWKSFTESGFFVPGQIRHLKSFADKNGNRFIFAALNSDKPRVFKYTNQ
jgi:enediyne biosynthesis protein E4